MPGDEYASVGSGALKLKGLKLKGSKITKHKKKKRKDPTTTPNELEKAISESNDDPQSQSLVKPPPSKKKDRAKSQDSGRERSADDDEEDAAPRVSHKTEAQRRFEEAKRKKLLEMAESADARPDLLKTHKERVEELNTYLSKLSEHHDMPKIGPG